MALAFRCNWIPRTLKSKRVMKAIAVISFLIGTFFIAQYILGSDGAKTKLKGPKVTEQVPLLYLHCVLNLLLRSFLFVKLLNKNCISIFSLSSTFIFFIHITKSTRIQAVTKIKFARVFRCILMLKLVAKKLAE